MNLSVDDAAMKSAVQGAILTALTPEKRDALVAKAIESLLTVPANDRYGRPTTSQIQDIFEMEVRNLARDVVRERLATDEGLKTQLAGLIVKAIAKLAEKEDLANLFAEAMTRALQEHR